MQLVVMHLPPGEEIGREMHPHVDQFFRIEQGEALFVVGDKEDHPVREGDGIVIPAGTYHNILNRSQTTPLRLYTIYSPPNHPPGTVDNTKTEAEAAEMESPNPAVP